MILLENANIDENTQALVSNKIDFKNAKTEDQKAKILDDCKEALRKLQYGRKRTFLAEKLNLRKYKHYVMILLKTEKRKMKYLKICRLFLQLRKERGLPLLQLQVQSQFTSVIFAFVLAQERRIVVVHVLNIFGIVTLRKIIKVEEAEAVREVNHFEKKEGSQARMKKMMGMVIHFSHI